MNTAAELEAAQRVLARRANAYDRLVSLLREGLNYRETGVNGSYKTRVRALLTELGELDPPALESTDPETEEFLRRWRRFATIKGIE